MYVPKGFQDYDDNDPDIEYRQKRWDYWAMLRKAKDEYIKETGQENEPGLIPYKFYEHLESVYGIKLRTGPDGITDKFDIVDEQKYLIFKLRFE